MSRYRRLETSTMMKQIGMIPVFYHTDFEVAKNVICTCANSDDSFASGLIYSFMEGKTPLKAANYGAAHGVLAITTLSDTAMTALKEVERLMKGATAKMDR